MPSIEIIDLDDTQDTLQGVLQQEYEITDPFDGNLATVVLAAGRTEEVGDQLYRVIDGDLPVTDSGVADGKVFIHLKALTATTAEATIEIDPGTFDPNKGGYYTAGGEKVIYAMTKSGGTTYSNKGRVLFPNWRAQQLGQIFPVHPDVRIRPNPFNFSRCDGVELMPTANFTTGNDTNVPDLTDERFLSGSTTYEVGGVNTVNLQHSHTVDSHSHTVNAHSHTVDAHNHQWFNKQGGSNSDQSFDANGNLDNLGSTTATSGTSIFMTPKNNAHLDENEYTDNQSPGTDNQSPGTDSQSPGTDSQLSAAQEFRPKYFQVLYYMRIN